MPAMPKMEIGDRLRLRTRIFPGHSYSRADQRNTSRSDLPADSCATVVETHGSDVRLEVQPDPTNMTAKGVEIWVPIYMIDVLFDSAAGSVDFNA